MKTKMTITWKYTLFFALGSILVGLTLLSLGAVTGGIDGIKKNTEPKEVNLTFDHIEDIDLATINDSMIKAGDVDKVTVTYYTDSKFINEVSVIKESKTLRITEKVKETIVSGFMEAGGYALNARDSRKSYDTIEVTVPKDFKLSQLKVRSNHSSVFPTSVTLEGLAIKTIDIASSAATIDQTTIDGGTLDLSYNSSIMASTIKHAELNLMDCYIEQTTLENSQLVNLYQHIDLSQSTLRNVTMTATQELDSRFLGYSEESDGADSTEYNELYREYNDTYVRFEKTRLENVTYQGNGEIVGAEVTLLGNVSFTGPFIRMEMELPEQGQTTHIIANSKNGTIKAYPELEKNASVTSDTEGNQFSNMPQKVTAKLTISSDYGDIYLGEMPRTQYP